MITPTVIVDTRQLDRAIATMLRETGKALPEVTRQAALYFAQSAAVATPPEAGRRKFTKKSKYRKVQQFYDVDGRKNPRSRWRVKYHTTRKKGSAWFTSQPAAKQLAEILYRGVGRAGWYASIAALGSSVADQPGGKGTKKHVGRWGSGTLRRELLAPVVTIRNVEGVMPVAVKRAAARRGQYMASKRLLGASRALMRGAARKGGLKHA